MQNMNKKAVTELIGTVLLLLLAISLVAILSVSIIKLVNQPSLAPETSCPILQFNNVLSIDQACYNKQTQDIEITIRRNSDESVFLNSLEFVVDGSATWECGNSCGTCKLLNPGNARKYFFEANGEEKSISIRTNNCVLDTKKIRSC